MFSTFQHDTPPKSISSSKPPPSITSMALRRNPHKDSKEQEEEDFSGDRNSGRSCCCDLPSSFLQSPHLTLETAQTASSTVAPQSSPGRSTKSTNEDEVSDDDASHSWQPQLNHFCKRMPSGAGDGNGGQSVSGGGWKHSRLSNSTSTLLGNEIWSLSPIRRFGSVRRDGVVLKRGNHWPNRWINRNVILRNGVLMYHSYEPQHWGHPRGCIFITTLTTAAVLRKRFEGHYPCLAIFEQQNAHCDRQILESFDAAQFPKWIVRTASIEDALAWQHSIHAARRQVKLLDEEMAVDLKEHLASMEIARGAMRVAHDQVQQLTSKLEELQRVEKALLVATSGIRGCESNRQPHLILGQREEEVPVVCPAPLPEPPESSNARSHNSTRIRVIPWDATSHSASVCEVFRLNTGSSLDSGTDSVKRHQNRHGRRSRRWKSRSSSVRPVKSEECFGGAQGDWEDIFTEDDAENRMANTATPSRLNPRRRRRGARNANAALISPRYKPRRHSGASPCDPKDWLLADEPTKKFSSR